MKIVKLPIQKLLVFFFARQGSGPYQIPSSSSFDMDLIILVLRKKVFADTRPIVITLYVQTFCRTITHDPMKFQKMFTDTL